jgi:hypothetical protein
MLKKSAEKSVKCTYECRKKLFLMGLTIGPSTYFEQKVYDCGQSVGIIFHKLSAPFALPSAKLALSSVG